MRTTDQTPSPRSPNQWLFRETDQEIASRARRLLLVEDEPAHAEIVRRTFEGLERSYRLTVASCLREARDYLAIDYYDLVVSDWNLPDGQGIDLVPDSNAPVFYAVLLMTSHGTEQMAVRALKAGSVDYIVKSEQTLADMPYLAERALREWDNRVARWRAEATIRESLREKEALLKEIHHRVKNNLQIISSLLQLQANEMTDDRLLTVFEASQTRIRSIALIHEMLYQSESLAQVELEPYLQSLAQMLLTTFCGGRSRPNVELNVSGCVVRVDTAIPLGLIANELITNALKYAFPDRRAGTVKVQCDRLPDGHSRLTIRDDGVGLPPDFDLETNASMGLKLVGMFTRKLRGQGTWHRNGVGLGYSLQFQEPPVAVTEVNRP